MENMQGVYGMWLYYIFLFLLIDDKSWEYGETTH